LCFCPGETVPLERLLRLQWQLLQLWHRHSDRHDFALPTRCIPELAATTKLAPPHATG